LANTVLTVWASSWATFIWARVVVPLLGPNNKLRPYYVNVTWRPLCQCHVGIFGKPLALPVRQTTEYEINTSQSDASDKPTRLLHECVMRVVARARAQQTTC
jgi:hypothetical protein